MQIPHTDHEPGERGQSLVEFALILPIVLFLIVGILDFSRVFTSMMAVESAAREAADYGAWQSKGWEGSPADTDSARYKTERGIKERACLGTRDLTDYVGSTVTSCTNPQIEIDLLDENGNTALNPDGTLVASSDCDKAERQQGGVTLGPCKVQIDLTYTFDLIVPIGLDFGGTRLGLPQKVEFTRTSIFAISDFTID